MVRLSNGNLIIQTVDFFTPVVDDPYQFGQIAAANSLSDIYAMGGEPLFALNIVGFPINELPKNILTKILQGGADKADEAGIPIVGGHSVDDREPKYGLVVTGEIDQENIWKNSGANIGDVLVLTKPLGRLENLEKLEQLRFLEAGYCIRTFSTSYKHLSVDNPEDLKFINKLVQDRKSVV